jgi:hypothetical protein
VDASDAVTLAVVALAAVVPLACVLFVALLRGYTISLHMHRPLRERRRRRRDSE